MPFMDGYEASRQIRELPIQRVPIIAVTAHTRIADRNRSIASGMDDFLTKPVDLEQLAELVARWCSTPWPPPTETLIGGSSSKASIEIFDEEGLLQRLMGDRPLARQILQGFLQDLPRQLERLRHRALTLDAQGGLRDAHTLKGSSATASATLLSATAQAMENAALRGDMERFGSLLSRADGQAEQLIAELERTNWIQAPSTRTRQTKEISTP
jgi:CheY-like chemotaxis protein